jgi:hypothetical protein
MIDIIDELRILTVKLDEQQVDYALCGGLALAIYEKPRATTDIDLLILADSVDAVFQIAKSLGYSVRGLDMSFADGAVEIRRISKIDPDSKMVVTLDLLLVTPHTQHVWDSRVLASWQGRPLTVVSRNGLIALKQLSGRPQDFADIEALTEKSNETDQDIG